MWLQQIALASYWCSCDDCCNECVFRGCGRCGCVCCCPGCKCPVGANAVNLSVHVAALVDVNAVVVVNASVMRKL